MQKIISNNDGASLVEIVATITIVSICLILIYNVLNFNIRQNGVNQEKSISANIANSSLNYFRGYDYEKLYDYLLTSNNGYYAKITEEECNNIFNDPACVSTLTPIINNKRYDSDDLLVYLLPYEPSNGESFTAESLDEYIETLDINTPYDNHYPYTIRIFVVVKSSINPKYDYILEGVTTNE